MSLAGLASLFQHINSGGTLRLYGLGATTRYNHVDSLTLLGDGLFRQFSSATVHDPSTAVSLILFDPPFNLPGLEYQGRFLQLTNLDGRGDLKVNLTDHGFNDETASLLFVNRNRGTEVKLSFRDIFLDKWKTVIDGELSGGAKRNGDPTLTWEMFPSMSHLDPNLTYLKIHQRLRIEIDWWPDYDASITYHIHLFLGGDKKLRGFVARWAYWIEGGVKADDIEERLRPAVISGGDTLNAELTTQLAAFSSFSFSDLYYLPGRQTGNAARRHRRQHHGRCDDRPAAMTVARPRVRESAPPDDQGEQDGEKEKRHARATAARCGWQ